MSELWQELHINAMNYKGNDNRRFLYNFGRKLKKYSANCPCYGFWKKWIKSNPPKYGPNGEYFAWTVKVHNAVNRKLGKSEISLNRAIKIYKRKAIDAKYNNYDNYDKYNNKCTKCNK